MKRIHLGNVDLNLLVIFDAIAAERHATKAAGRLGLTQPAVSHALSRLRHLFNDPLFVRSPKGLVPTSMATELEPAVRAVLEQVEAVLQMERAFDRATTTRRFVIGLSGYSAFVLLPPLMERMNSLAPDASLIVKHTNINLGLSMLEQGEVELIAGVFPSPPAFLREELLYVEDFVCAGRAGHPLLKEDLDLETYLSLRHLHVSMRGDPHGIVDNALDDLGRRRTVALTVGHFLIAPLLVQDSELVATEPRRLFERWSGPEPLRLVRPPIAIPSFRVVQTWHGRYENDPAHMWLREMIRSIASTV